MPAVVEALAELGGFPLGEVVVGDVRRVVLDRQHAHLAEVGDAGQRAPLVERLRRGIGLEIVGHVVGGLHDAPRIVGPQRLGAAHDRHRLQLLLAHHGPAAVLRRDVAVVAVDGGEAHEVLAGRPDGVHRQVVAAHADVAVERVLRLPGVLAEQRLGVAQLDLVVVDVEVDPVPGLALDHDGVVAGVLEVRPEEAVGLRRGRPVRHGANRHDGQRAGAPHRHPGQRPGGQHEPVVGMVPRHVALALGRLAIEDHRAEAGAADPVAHVGRRPRLGPALPLREIHAQQLAGVGAGHRRLDLRLRSRCQRRSRHTATGVSPGAFDGRPRTVSGSSRPVVLDAMKAGFTSNGFFLR